MERPTPKNKLTEKERQEIITTINNSKYRDLTPSHIAYAPNEVWTWDITWLKAGVKGFYYKLYLILDMYSRLIVAHEVWETEKSSYAEQLIRKATLSQ